MELFLSGNQQRQRQPDEVVAKPAAVFLGCSNLICAARNRRSLMVSNRLILSGQQEMKFVCCFL
jgi:hypothetical protein